MDEHCATLVKKQKVVDSARSLPGPQPPSKPSNLTPIDITSPSLGLSLEPSSAAVIDAEVYRGSSLLNVAQVASPKQSQSRGVRLAVKSAGGAGVQGDGEFDDAASFASQASGTTERKAEKGVSTAQWRRRMDIEMAQIGTDKTLSNLKYHCDEHINTWVRKNLNIPKPKDLRDLEDANKQWELGWSLNARNISKHEYSTLIQNFKKLEEEGVKTPADR